MGHPQSELPQNRPGQVGMTRKWLFFGGEIADDTIEKPIPYCRNIGAVSSSAFLNCSYFTAQLLRGDEIGDDAVEIFDALIE